MNGLGELVQKEIKRTYTVLDLGCGNMNAISGIKCKTLVGVDVWYPYVNYLKKYAIVLCMKIDKLTLNCFINRSFDIVTLLDFVEHLDKEEAFEIIRHAERIARKKVIIFTPEGFLKQDDGEDWGECNPKYQSHKCGFSIEEFRMMGYNIIQHLMDYRDKKVKMLYAVKIVEKE